MIDTGTCIAYVHEDILWGRRKGNLLLHLKRGTIVATAEEYIASRRSGDGDSVIMERQYNYAIPVSFWIEVSKAIYWPPDWVKEMEDYDGWHEATWDDIYNTVWPNTDERKVHWARNYAMFSSPYPDREDPTAPSGPNTYTREAFAIFLPDAAVDALLPRIDIDAAVGGGSTTAIPGRYVSPFISLMLAAVDKFNVTAEWSPLKAAIVEHFMQQKLPNGAPISKNMAEYMATFCRPPSAMDGGNMPTAERYGPRK